MVRSPRVTLAAVVAAPRSIDLAAVIVLICAVLTVGFLMTPVGRLAALDQQVRQLEAFGADVNDRLYAELRRWLPYRPLVSGAAICFGWPAAWAAAAALIRAVGARRATPSGASRPTYRQVFAVLVHASSVLVVRDVIATPLNYARESLGGATTAASLVPGLASSSFAGHLLGAVDMFALWWIVLVAMGLGMLYGVRAGRIAGWLFGSYAAAAAVLALAESLSGGI